MRLYSLLVLLCLWFNIPVLFASPLPSPTIITTLSWQPQGSFLAIGTDAGVQLVDQDFQPMDMLSTTGHVDALAWASDGSLLAIYNSQECWLLVYDVTSAQIMVNMRINSCFPALLSWAHGGRWLAVHFFSEGPLYLIDMMQTTETILIADDVIDYRWHPTEALLGLLKSDRSLMVMKAGHIESDVQIPDAGYALNWSPDGAELITAAITGTKQITVFHESGLSHVEWDVTTLRSWDSTTGELRQAMPIIDDVTIVTSVLWLPDDRVGGECRIRSDAGFYAYAVCLWHLTDGSQISPGLLIAGGSSSSGGIALSPDRNYIAATVIWRDSFTKLFALVDGEDLVLDGISPVWTSDSLFVTTIYESSRLLHYDIRSGQTWIYPIITSG